MLERELAHGGRLLFQAPWLDEHEADDLFAALARDVPWQEQAITLFGRRILQPRLTAFFGDPCAVYTYSGLTMTPLAWTAPLSDIRVRVERFANVPFNAVLLNYYRDGRDSMGMHADDEPELGKDPLIASLSLGATRRFVLLPRKGKDGAVELQLSHGSLLVMAGTTQHHYRHGLPKQRGAGARINLTFRRVVGAR